MSEATATFGLAEAWQGRVLWRGADATIDPHATGQGYSVTLHSGLPLVKQNGIPLLPEESAELDLQLAIKGAFDRVAALILIVLLAPLLVAIALLIKISSPGPVLFLQLREGRHGKPFQIYKFRSMHKALCDATGVTQAVDGDERVTAVGRLLRKTNLDELPQLFNVLRGEMALVGPRPHPFSMRAAGKLYKELVPYYDARLAMTPGITGWAQCNGLRGPTIDKVSATERIDHDLAYIQNYSLLLDLKALWFTVARESFGGRGI